MFNQKNNSFFTRPTTFLPEKYLLTTIFFNTGTLFLPQLFFLPQKRFLITITTFNTSFFNNFYGKLFFKTTFYYNNFFYHNNFSLPHLFLQQENVSYHNFFHSFFLPQKRHFTRTNFTTKKIFFNTRKFLPQHLFTTTKPFFTTKTTFYHNNHFLPQ